MLLSRALAPLLSKLPYQTASFFPEKKDPPYWLENLTQPGHQKKFERLYPWIHKVEKLKLLPGDEPQPYQPFLQPLTFKQKKRQRTMEKNEKKRQKRNIITEDEVNIVVISNNIMGSWKKLHPITKQINKKPLDHAILQCYFKSDWSPRYRDVLITLLNARRIARDGGVEDTSDLWVNFSTCSRHFADHNGLTVHAKGKTGSLIRYWSNVSITVVKGRPKKKNERLKYEEHSDHYRKYLPPIPIPQDVTFK